MRHTGPGRFILRLLPLALLIAEVALVASPANAVTYTNSSGITINTAAALGCPMTTTATPYPSNIAVPTQGNVADVNVSITLTHSFPDDVAILLVGPSGASVIVMSDSGSGLDVSAVGLTFDDAAVGTLPDNAQISSGTYRPSQGVIINALECSRPVNFPAPAPAGPYGTALSVFNGSNPNGTWNLYVIDDTGQDGGSIASWSLDITFAGSGSPQQTLTVLPVGQGSGTVTSEPPGINCPPDCTEQAPIWTRFILTAHPAAGSSFRGWYGACSGTGQCGVTVQSSNTTVAAWFDPGTSPPPPPPPPPPGVVTHEVRASRVGHGTIVSDPVGIECGSTCTASFEEGSSVILMATARPGWHLDRWRYGCAGQGSVCTLDVTSNRRARAVFVRD